MKAQAQAYVPLQTYSAMRFMRVIDKTCVLTVSDTDGIVPRPRRRANGNIYLFST